MTRTIEFGRRAVNALPSIVEEVSGRLLSEPPHPPRVPPAIDPQLPAAAGSTVIDKQGFDTGIADVAFPAGGVPLLNSFFFNWRARTDHHINQIMFLPDFPAQQKMSVSYQDDDPDEFFYHIRHHALSAGGIERVNRELDLCTGSCNRQLFSPSDDVFVLSGFQLAFTGGRDHHIDEIALIENSGQINVRFNDVNKDDNFVWRLRYARAPRNLFAHVGESHGTGRGAAYEYIPEGPLVIRGFSFNFLSSDHHIRDIGIFEGGGGRLEVYFEDKNGDDGFAWIVKWAILK